MAETSTESLPASREDPDFYAVEEAIDGDLLRLPRLKKAAVAGLMALSVVGAGALGIYHYRQSSEAIGDQPTATPTLAQVVERRRPTLARIIPTSTEPVPIATPPATPIVIPPDKPPRSPHPTVEVREQVELERSILAIDISGEGLTRAVREHFGFDLPSPEELAARYGFELPLTPQKLQTIVPRSPKEEITLLAYALLDRYDNHAQKVLRAFSVGDRIGQSGYQERWSDFSPYLVTPGPEAIQALDLEHDPAGNPILTISLNPDALANLVDRSNAVVINLSIEMRAAVKYEYQTEVANFPGQPMPQERTLPRGTAGGVVWETHYFGPDGTEITKAKYERFMANWTTKVPLDPEARRLVIFDGYLPDRALRTLEPLADLASRFPDRLFVAAAGNPTQGILPDITAARAVLASQGRWPNNLMMVGVWDDREEVARIGPNSLGADAYVGGGWLEGFGVDPASSFAAPIGTLIAEFYYRDHDRLKLGPPRDAAEVLQVWYGYGGSFKDEIDGQVYHVFLPRALSR